jgi:Na+-transporting NADH:ubiquinone oxidoreductase subunit NqrB
MKTELKGNAVFAILFAMIGLTCLVGAAFIGAYWHLYTFLICTGMTYMFIVARDDSGDNVWKWVKKFYRENFKDNEVK